MNIVLLGSSGQLGGWLKTAIEQSIHTCFIPTYRLHQQKELQEFCFDCQASAVINAAGLNNKKCEELKSHSLQEVFDVNCYWPAALSGRLKHQGVDFYHISTEYVFGHENGEGPFSELVEPIPSSLYGESKYLGDKGIVDEQGYVIRAALLPDIFPYKVAATNLMASKLRASEACRRIVSYVSGGLPLKSRQSVLHICGVRRSVADFVRDELQAHDVTFQALDDGVTRPLDSSLCSVYSQDKL